MMIARCCLCDMSCFAKWLPSDWQTVLYRRRLTGNLTYNTAWGIIDFAALGVTTPTTTPAAITTPFRERAEVVREPVSFVYQHSAGPYQWTYAGADHKAFVGVDDGDIFHTVGLSFQGVAIVPDCRWLMFSDGVWDLFPDEPLTLDTIALGGPAPEPASVTVDWDKTLQPSTPMKLTTSQAITVTAGGKDYGLRVYYNDVAGFGPFDLDEGDHTMVQNPRSGWVSLQGRVYDLSSAEAGIRISTPVDLRFYNGDLTLNLRGIEQVVEAHCDEYQHRETSREWVSGTQTEPLVNPPYRLNPPAVDIALAYEIGTGKFGQPRRTITMAEICAEMGVSYDPTKAYVGLVSIDVDVDGTDVAIADEDALVLGEGDQTILRWSDYAFEYWNVSFFLNPLIDLHGTIRSTYEPVLLGTREFIDRRTLAGYLDQTLPDEDQNDQWQPTTQPDEAQWKTQETWSVDLFKNNNVDFSSVITGDITFTHLRGLDILSSEIQSYNISSGAQDNTADYNEASQIQGPIVDSVHHFQDISLSPAFTISSATLSLTGVVTSGSGVNLDVILKSHDVDNAPAPSTITNYSSYALSATIVSFSNTDPWSTPIDVTAIVQSIIDRAGWSSGNAINIVVSVTPASGTYSVEWTSSELVIGGT